MPESLFWTTPQVFFLFFSYFTNFFRIAFDIESLWMALPLCVHQQRSGTAASDQGLSGVRETPHV